MPLTQEKVVIARCDAPDCKTRRFGTKEIPPSGYYADVQLVRDDEDGVTGYAVQVFGCSTAHVNKAVVARLADPSHQGITHYSTKDEDGHSTPTGQALDHGEPPIEKVANAPEAVDGVLVDVTS